MLRFASATDSAIRNAKRNGTLRAEERASRFVGETYIAISDDFGVIEVQATRADADKRIAECCA